MIQAPGNHEFDDGIEGLEPFLKKVTFPIVCANCDLSDLPELKNFISPSITVELNGHKIGIIGFILPEVTVSRKQTKKKSISNCVIKIFYIFIILYCTLQC